MPGFSFADYQVPRTESVPWLPDEVGLPRRQRLATGCAEQLSTSRAILVCPFRHRYYDPLRLPNVHREILRYPARHSLPVASAFAAHKGSTRRSHGPFRRGALVSRSTPTGVTPH